ncbi:MAG TPA: MBOAT family O-acyltransferase, partial [Chthoniobacteraceae bacterium]|nr:MBOAT family O-acyltransferase [Chthoniobacteraceae bacterium]
MLFNSLEFAIFFPIVAVLYFLLAQRHRTLLLLVASCVFYMAFIPAYIAILGVTILIDYFAGMFLEHAQGRRRKVLLWVSIVATCLVLFVFKYFYFFTDNFIGMAGIFGWKLTGPLIHIILPVGLSFHTFQSLSYVVEVYHGRQPAERNFLVYATYVMFFPQLVAGPIERPQNLLHQFYERHEFDYDRITSGLKRMAWGFFKKLVIADRLALYVNDVYAAPSQYNGLQLTLATVFFAYQIYCDFSGYSDIAIGSARVLGFRLMENFNNPYWSRSISEFWRRWHISLSTWFRDYVYLPLGGNRVTPLRRYRNLLVTFGLSGLWHGAAWTYVIWGLINGVYLICGVVSKAARDRWIQRMGLQESGVVRSALGIISTFTLVCFAWVIFRAKDMADASYILTHFWRNWDFGQISTPQFLLRQLPVAVLSIVFLEVVQFVHSRVSITQLHAYRPDAVRWS